MGRIHHAADRGFSQNAGEYEAARPGYPPDAVRFLIDRLDLHPGRTVLDVGAGTGKLTRLITPSGAKVIAVEPVEAMRSVLAAAVPEVEVYDAIATSLPLADGAVDAVVCAQAFHWFASAETLGEFARVLGAGGPLALVWNVRDGSVPWVAAFTDLLHPFEGDRPDHNTGAWRVPFDGCPWFGPLETTSFRHSQPMTPDLLAARAASTSFVGALDPDTKAALLDRVRALGSEQGESFEMPYRTDVHITRRAGGRG